MKQIKPYWRKTFNKIRNSSTSTVSTLRPPSTLVEIRWNALMRSSRRRWSLARKWKRVVRTCNAVRLRLLGSLKSSPNNVTFSGNRGRRWTRNINRRRPPRRPISKNAERSRTQDEKANEYLQELERKIAGQDAIIKQIVGIDREKLAALVKGVNDADKAGDILARLDDLVVVQSRTDQRDREIVEMVQNLAEGQVAVSYTLFELARLWKGNVPAVWYEHPDRMDSTGAARDAATKLRLRCIEMLRKGAATQPAQ